MDNNLRAAHITQRRRPMTEEYEILCKIFNFDPQTYESMMLCDESLDEEDECTDFVGNHLEDTPMTPTKPTVLTGTNAPERPKRQDVFTFDF